MKQSFIILLLSSCATSGLAQLPNIDSLQRLLTTVTKEDSTRVERLLLIAEAYEYNKPDSGLFYASKAMQLAQRLSYTSGEAWACIRVGEVNWVLGDYAQSMQYDLRATSLFQQMPA